MDTTWLTVTQKSLGKREILRQEMRRREVLYSEFLSEAVRWARSRATWRTGVWRARSESDAHFSAKRVRECSGSRTQPWLRRER